MEEPRYLVIPAAGLGTRMRQAYSDTPKEMLPIDGLPAIQYALQEGLSAGLKKLVIIISKEKEDIRRYFEDKKFRQNMFPHLDEEIHTMIEQCSITFLYQQKPLGEADALSLAKDFVGHEVLAVMYPDNIYFPAPGALLVLKSVFGHYKKDVIALFTVSSAHAEGIGNSGRVRLSHVTGDMYKIEHFYPKGEGYFIPRFRGELRACGIFIVHPHIFEYIERARDSAKTGEFTDIYFRKVMLQEQELLGCRLPGRVYDIGNPKGYELCQHYRNSGRP
ncbi:MAG: 2-C-methyl-D-erythritol 4-phosphate cytidylyltransferase [Nitrospiraceae bacterium]|nr:MAG: 2-C-methyl-D-erythritol 4-phosphate cytidylyltransferase [Nitrospiraceae bacterium]